MSSDATNRLAEALLDHFRERPDARAASFVTAAGRVVLGFADIERDCRRFAAAYRHAGVGQGGTVLIFLRHVPELYGSFFGAMLAGHVPSLMPCTSPRQDPGIYWRSHDELLRRIRPDAIVASDRTFAEMEAAGLDLSAIRRISIDGLSAENRGEAFSPPPGGHTALLQHSSGTTGLKKGVRLSFDAICAQVESYAGVLSLGDEDRIVSWLPLYHDMGLIACMITPALLGIPVTHIDPFHWLSRPGMLLDLLEKERGTFCWLPNFAFEHLTLTAGRNAANHDLGSVRAFINCSEPCRASTFHRFTEAFASAGVTKDRLQCCYAMAETVFAVAQTPLGRTPRVLNVDSRLMRTEGRVADAEPGAPETLEIIETGAVIPGLRVEIRDEARRPLPERHVGEIAIAGDFLFDGYNADPERTAARIRNGFYHSGDLGFLADGRLYVLGRTDDLMIVNGRNIYGHEVEAEIAGIDGLKPGRTVVLAREDERIGSRVMIVIAERAAGAEQSDRDIRREIADRVFSVFQIMPGYVEIVDEGWLIKTTSGKIGRSANLAKFLEARNGQG